MARRDAEDGFSRSRRFKDCPDAREAYEREYRREARRLEEEREERDRARRAAERRAEEAWREEEARCIEEPFEEPPT